jgi:SecD/SecF fusion protein
VTTRRSQLLLLGAILLALVGAVLLAVPGTGIHKKPVLGLDLQGGLEVVLKAVPPKGHKLTQDDLQRAKDIMDTRINKLGVSQPDVRIQQPDQIVIQLAGVHNPEAAARLIGQTAQLQFFDLEADAVGPSKGSGNTIIGLPKLYDLLYRVKGLAAGKNAGPYYLFKTVPPPKGAPKATAPTQRLLAGPLPTRAELLRPYKGEAPKGTLILAVPAGMTVVSCQAATGCLGATGSAAAPVYYYLLAYHPNNPAGPPELTGKDLKLSGTQADIDPTTGAPVVTMQFTGHGGKVFHDITRKEAQRGAAAASLAGHGGDSNPTVVSSYSGHFGIVLDGELKSSPYIDYKQNPDGISGTSAQITLGQGGSITEAKSLALILQTGALPVNFKQIERTDVSATLGKDSLHQAWVAALIGLLVVAVFLLALYRFLGLVAVIGLAIYAAFYYAALLLFNVTLTLPGFAGLILTIGVAADANVVIFERIKEEVRAGKSVRAAIAAGYGKGFHTIIDANVVTAITALVLFAVATAEVKGFALTLLIGTIISLLTAVAATRVMLSLLAGFKWFGNARFMGASGRQRGRFLQLDFMRRRYVWFAISGVIVLTSLGALGFKGLNLGIDFKGGTQVSFSSAKPLSLAAVRQETNKIGQGDAIVQGRGKSSGSDQYQQFQIRTKSLTSAQQSQLNQGLKTDLGVKSIGTKNVSSSFGSQIAKSAILAIIVSLLLIILYITMRFDFKYAIPVIVAMLHDVVITVGIYALLGREVTSSTVAAVLTVLGYSIYDTIIIFDRIRENVPIMRKQPFAAIANISLWETIRRSLATTLITLLPVAALLFFGGATLKDFAFALMIGITAGAYSSIFVAAPLLTILKEREPEWIKLKRNAPKETKATEPEDAGAQIKEASEQALAAEPTPELEDVIDATPSTADAQARRAARKARRRQHGRPR